MGRKRKNRKKNQRKVFNKKKFRQVYCPQCALCTDNKAAFCFDSIYKANPVLFTTGVFPNLIAAAENMAVTGAQPGSIPTTIFSQIFCETGVCTNGEPNSAFRCAAGDKCQNLFAKQVRFVASKASQKKKKKKKKKHRQVYQPFATFFCRDDDDFKAEVRRILYGDNDNEQDKDKELPDGSTGSTSGPAKGGES